MPSLVAEIGAVIEKHMKSIGLIEHEDMSDSTKQILAEKRAQFEEVSKSAVEAKTEESADSNPFPDTAQLCKKCSTKAVIIMDGCATCLNCGDSKCG